MSQTNAPKPDRSRYWLNLTLAGFAAQAGCATLVIILGAVLGGLWLDAQFQTRPLITLILVFASIPVSLLVMFFIVRSTTSKIKGNLKHQNGEEADIGKTS
ncbi:AtpZ/AtpI family protein [Anaerolinea sp.]|uniref:AtpZ/AtpI family protein n=1 Tax=Anaerolinea sp. TaxID=1872519 RepID=UPI002ACE23DE|nr:AtpZ/AtpI family protein [Anaerolinea sp.]